jgi:putative MATE family efflux protein
LLTLALPIMGINLLSMASQIINAFWVGRLGAAAVAAVSVSMPLTFLIISLGSGFSIAGTTLVAQYAGAGNRAMVNHVAAQTLLAVTGLSMALGLGGFLAVPGLLRLLGVAPDVHANALMYMRVAFLSLPLSFGTFMIQALFRGVGQTMIPLVIMAGSVAANFVLVPMLAFGLFGIPPLGVLGAALATMITQLMAFLSGAYLLGSGRYRIHIAWREFSPDFQYIKRAFLLGYPASIEQSARGLCLLMMTFLITSFGTVVTAAYGVGSNVLNFVVMPAMGFSAATSVLVGQNIGAGKIKRAEEVARISASLSFAVLSGIGLLCLLLARPIAAFFVPSNPQVIAEAAVFIRTVAWSFGFIGLQFAMMGVLRSSGNMLAAMTISLISQWILQFPAAFILSRETALGADGLWWAFPAANIGASLTALAWFARGTWKDRRLIEETPEQAVLREVEDQVMIS